MDEKAIARFWRNVDKRGPEECWEWRRVRDKKGYGRVRLGGVAGVTRFTHRVAVALDRAVTLGSLDGMHVCHRCDNPPCCNPAHLFLGTQQDNIDDMDRKNRRITKLSEEQVADIRERRAGGATYLSIALIYGVSRPAIQNACRKGWRFVTSHPPIP